ncbi:hypothetical protein AGMMS5026_08610 [Endomicrobiia bacterium]|uniref:hypothetical protein n=1 Tax=Endomicrobium trichonymphae TaxID=1408204 RepID=UPI000BBA5E4B|nr:hypothetical protein [Candidatus Endomicrobium trichonymphae]GHT04330.1 hypothetical protein AGMMS49523_01640 [Endomicrobiia bacterium]GHT13104.1 hypothetical protein AGMMS49571_06220 [Endomicrobiia bacterium]GHT20174.1 hypothetical protein AGMMS49929_05840 [Endomicrobiia bacterium]GHT31755.1 hypothetical protein AGMMS5026_08610 [Endomicrobiia bacterium]
MKEGSRVVAWKLGVYVVALIGYCKIYYNIGGGVIPFFLYPEVKEEKLSAVIKIKKYVKMLGAFYRGKIIKFSERFWRR